MLVARKSDRWWSGKTLLHWKRLKNTFPLHEILPPCEKFMTEVMAPPGAWEFFGKSLSKAHKHAMHWKSGNRENLFRENLEIYKGICFVLSVECTLIFSERISRVSNGKREGTTLFIMYRSEASGPLQTAMRLESWQWHEGKSLQSEERAMRIGKIEPHSERQRRRQ